MTLASAQHSHDREPVGCGKGDLLKRVYLRGGLPSLREPLIVAALRGFTDTDVLSNFLQIEAVPTSQTISGTNLMTIKALNPVSSFEFSLDQALPISSLKLNGAAITYTRLDSVRVQANLGTTIAAGTTFTLEISYSGSPTQGAGLGSFYFNTHSGSTIVETLSEPYFCYTWWPTKEDNTDKAINDIWVTVPSTMSVAANGLYQGYDSLTGSRRRYKYQGVNPMAPYLLAFAATNYNKFTDSWSYGGSTLPLEFYIWPESDTTSNRNAWLNVKQMLTTESDLYGIYPFMNEKYGMYQFSFSGGMEHQTMTGMGGFWESVTAHELGHQWWGDMVTCATWMDIWLNEGFATYTEAMWYEKKPGSTGLPALQSAMSSRRPTTTNGSVYCYDISDPNRIFSSNFSYRKAAWVLHMLRHVMGDTKFFQLYAEYRNRFAYSAATTADFQDTAESVYGGDLSWFFDKWVMGIGSMAIEYGYSTVTVNGQSYLQLQLKQVQNSAYPKFTMPVDVRITTSGGTTNHVIWTSLASQHYLLPYTPGTSLTVGVDPDTWILWTSRTNIAWAAGPPKIAQASIVPNKTYVRPPASITFTLQSNVNFNASYVTLLRSGVSQPITTTYNSSTKTVTVTPAGRLAAGAYVLQVSDLMTAMDSGQKLDGEISTGLPSGNGVAGGNAQIPFTVNPDGPREP